MTTAIANKVDMVQRVSLTKRARSPRVGSLVSRRGKGLLVVLELDTVAARTNRHDAITLARCLPLVGGSVWINTDNLTLVRF